MQAASAGSPPLLPQRDEKATVRRFVVGFGLVALFCWAVVLVAGRDWRTALSVLDSGEKIKSRDFVLAHVKWGMYWGALANALIATGLAATARWWAGRLHNPERSPVAARVGPRTWLVLLLVLAAAGALRWPRMGLSLYNDEAHGFKRYFAGYFQERSDGTTRWRPADWVETLWLNKVGNNSTPFSALSRLSHERALKWTHVPVGSVNETGLRFPALAAGLLALGVLWGVGRQLFPATPVCWWLLVLGALHPWHVRYSTEARGYSFTFLGVALCLYFTVRAWRENRWRWWLAMGAAQFFAVWSFSGSLYYLVAFNGLLMAGWSWRVWTGRMGWRNLAPPLVGMTVGGMLTVPLMLPMLPQLLGALTRNISAKGHMGWVWWRDVGSTFLSGVRWGDGDPANPLNLSVQRWLDAQPWLWLAGAALALILIFGAIRIMRAGGAGPVLLLAGPLAVFLAWASLSRSGNYLHLWYLLHSLPGWLVVMAAATVSVGGAGGRIWAVLVKAALILVMGCWLGVDLKLATRTKEDLRGVAEAVPAGALRAAAFSDVEIYDRDAVIIEDPAQLDPLIARAKHEQKPLFVSFSRKIADPAFEKMFTRIETSGEFEKIRPIWGLEEGQFSHVLYKLR